MPNSDLNSKDKIALARLEEKFKNLSESHKDLKERYKLTQEDLIKKSEEISEAHIQNKLLEKELKRNVELLYKDFDAFLDNMQKIELSHNLFEKKVTEELKTIKEKGSETFLLYGKMAMYFIGGVFATVSTFIGIGILKF
jgi:ABC-type antimicrobial peptide transport system permease subunit